MNWKTFFWLGTFAAAASLAHAVSPTRLQGELAKGAKVTVIDVRSTELYQRGHIPGAINIPAAVCNAKKLPPLGRVVVYDGGIGDNLAEGALTALNAKPGIKAEALDGGFAAWESAKLPDTKGRGTDDQFLPMVTYQQLKTNATDDIVLVDLRKPRPDTANSEAKSAPPLTDLKSAFPQARVEKSAFGVSGVKKSSSGEAMAPLLVLIDNGDGSAWQTAKALRANGINRFAILAGGEEIIARQGQSGSKRLGTTVTLPNLPAK
jgi:rhodanese-related sulfurtransferase